MAPKKNTAIHYSIKAARNGSPIIVISRDGREAPLHSAVEPERESRVLEGAFNPQIYDTLIVLGTGLGYHLLQLKHNIDRYSRVILIDILGGLEKQITAGPGAFLAAAPGVIFLSGLDAEAAAERLGDIIDLSVALGIEVMEHPASLRLFPDYYRAIKKSIESLINKKAGNEATKKAFGLRYAKNILRNAPLASRLRPVRELFSTFAGHPVMIIASGPSLDSAWQAVESRADRAFIIAVDSAMPALHSRGIVPDFVLVVDPQPYVHEHLQGLDPGNTLAILSISASPLAFAWARSCGRADNSRVFVSLNSHPLAQIMEAMKCDAGSIDSGTGNVAGDALRLALDMGFDEIMLAGFDFSFSRYVIYARGTAYQRRYCLYYQNRLATAESKNMAYIFDSSKKFVHEGRYTRRVFLQYRDSLEDLIGRSHKTPVSLTDPGLSIGGVAPGDRSTPGPALDKEAILRGALATPATRPGFDLREFKKAIGGPLFTELAAACLTGEQDRGRLKKLIEALL
jgi:hypothetical protein